MGVFLDATGLAYLWGKIKTHLDTKVSVSRTINGKMLDGDITISASDVNAVPLASVGAAGGVASLDENGTVPSSQLPSYVDDVIEYDSIDNFPSTGESGKIYIDTTTGKTYRWGGTIYAEISESLALGEMESTAYRGDRGKIAYDHSQSAHAPFNAEANVQSDWNETDTTSDAYIKNKPTNLVADGGNADTVNGHTVESDVPANAKFTDTVYTLPTAGETLGGVKTTSTVSSASGYTACPIIDGVPYYKDTNSTYSAITNAEIDAIFEK